MFWAQLKKVIVTKHFNKQLCIVVRRFYDINVVGLFCHT